MTPEPRTLGPLRLAAAISRGAPVDPLSFRTVWGIVRPAAAAQGLAPPGARFATAFGFTTLGLSGMQWYAASVIVDDGAVIGAPLEELRVPGGRSLSWTYVGGYDGLGTAWVRFAEQLAKDAVALDTARPGLEIYADDGAGGAPPRTELLVPVR